MIKLLTIPLILGFVALGGCFESDEELLSKASKLYTRENSKAQGIAEAFKIYSALSENGNVKGQYMLARMYERGDGIPYDEKKAFELLSRASANGLGDASFRIHLRYIKPEFGFKKENEYRDKLFYLKKSAQQGSQIGLLGLGDAYQAGSYGIEKDYKRALEYLGQVTDKDYLPSASFIIYVITSKNNSPEYSPAKAVSALEARKGIGSPVFDGYLAQAYSGVLGGEKEPSIANKDKLERILKEFKAADNKVALAIYDMGVEAETGFLKSFLEAGSAPRVDPFFSGMFCSVLGPYFIQGIEGFSLEDGVQGCSPAANRGDSYSQYILSALYVRAEKYEDAYHWAKVASLSGSKSGDDLAKQLADVHILAQANELDKIALSDYETIKARGPAFPMPKVEQPWY